jgi:hypothetical protein
LNSKALALLALSWGLLAGSGSAIAKKTGSYAEQGATRFFGGSAGAGRFAGDCEDCTHNGVVLRAHAGAFVTRHLALVGELGAFASILGEAEMARERVERLQVTASGAARYWLLPRNWIGMSTGIVQRYTTTDDAVAIRWGGAVELVAGFDTYLGSALTIDAQVRLGTVFYARERIYQGSLSVGINWH